MTPSAKSPRDPKRRATSRKPTAASRPATRTRPAATPRSRPAAARGERPDAARTAPAATGQQAAPAPPAAGADPAVMRPLRALLEACAPALVVQRDDPAMYELATRKPYQGKPMFFGAVAARKGYVSFHLMPIYVFPELLNGISPELRERLHGKSCFNFRDVSPKLLQELAGLTVAGLDLFQQADLA